MVWGGVVLLCAFVIICVHTATIWPWTKIVHEDGRHTLLDIAERSGMRFDAVRAAADALLEVGLLEERS